MDAEHENEAEEEAQEPQEAAASMAEILRSALRVACKGFVVGAGLHVGQKLISGVTSRKLTNSPAKFLPTVISGDMVRFGSFIALAGSTYKLILSILRKKYKTKDGWHAIVAGFAAGLVSIMDDPQRRRTLSFFIVARAVGALILTLHRRGYLPTVPYFVTMVFGICESLIILAVTHFPELLPQGYYRSILSWSMYYSEEKLQLYFRNPSPHFIPCSELMHQGSCHMCALNDFYNGCILYFKIYLTLYSLPLVLFRTSKLFKNTKESIVTLLQNASVSALFFAVDATVVKYGLCLLRNVWGRPPPVPYFIPLLAGLLGSLGLLIERESRRRELLYYVLPQMFYSFWKLLCIKKPLGLHKLPYKSVLMISLSLMALMHAFEREKESISPLINRSLQFLLN